MSESLTSARLALPYLASGQAQKEATHNEALARLDLAVQASVEAVGPIAPPATPVAGSAWVVGAGATGAWAGHDREIAGWTASGWRFLAPREGMAAWSVADRGVARYVGGRWTVAARGAPIVAPAGGGVVDVEARAGLAAILAILRAQGAIEA